MEYFKVEIKRTREQFEQEKLDEKTFQEELSKKMICPCCGNSVAVATPREKCTFSDFNTGFRKIRTVYECECDCGCEWEIIPNK